MAGRLSALEAAQTVASERYPECYLALLAGSVVRGEASKTSDLDIVIVTGAPEAPYRESFTAHDWPVEAFVHTESSVYDYFERNAKRRRPSLQTMVVDGEIIKDSQNFAATLKKAAKSQLEKGPPPLRDDEILEQRYFITDDLDDFIGAKDATEALFVLSELLPKACDFIFDTRGEWRGGSKWTPRQLQKVDAELYQQLVEGLEVFTKRGERTPLIEWVEAALLPYGGRYFDGFSVGKNANGKDANGKDVIKNNATAQ